MKKQAVCEYCGMVFEEKPDNEYYYNYKLACVEHEITHLNLEGDFRNNLKESLDRIDKKYKSESKISKINVSACWDSYYGKDITYDFEVKNTKIDINIIHKIEVQYNEKENVPTSDEIIKLLEHHFFIPTIDNKYEGLFRYEDFCGGDGADDFMIGESYMHTIYEAFKGKKVRIEVIE